MKIEGACHPVISECPFKEPEREGKFVDFCHENTCTQISSKAAIVGDHSARELAKSFYEYS